MRLIAPIALIFLIGCGERETTKSKAFTDVTEQSGISFRNDLTITERLNPYTYRNFYNGAGVAVGDINNDGLLDIYLSGNQVGNKLYLNTGDFKFKDITDQAGVACKGVWSTGVTFADVNGDGLLDLYVCKSGDPDVDHRNNELFINNGNLTFTERSKEYGLDVRGLSVQAAFFDFDRDSDLDCYLLTNSIRSVGNYDLVKDQRLIPDQQGGGNKFFINDGGKFRDATNETGIYHSSIGFGLGITLGDFNNDAWADIFISNDFFERDYLYINNQKGGFIESLPDYFESISMGSMGADYADLNNDGQPELFVTEMLPDSLSRRKTKTVFENWNKYQLNIESGYHHQVSRNVLQTKAPGEKRFLEIGRMAGVAGTEWSWGALLFDMNNDGLRDIFVANGIFKDLLDRDYLTYTGAEENVRKIIREEEQNAILKLIGLMPSSQFSNYAFVNDGNLSFRNRADELGLGGHAFSTGSAYGDFDNDGDLDLIVNNINARVALYRNNTDSLSQSITLILSSKKNTHAVGTEVRAYAGGRQFFADNFVTRGFQSSVQPRITIGVGKEVTRLDSVVIHWPEGDFSVLYGVQTGKIQTIVKEEVEVRKDYPEWIPRTAATRMARINTESFRHKGSELVDFNRDRLIPMMYSNETPAIARGDINRDGIDEFYVGGGKDQAGVILEYTPDKFTQRSPDSFKSAFLGEETKSMFTDIDGDGDLDLFIATGGRYFPKTSSAQLDHILLNDGKGNFSISPKQLPYAEFVSTSVAKPIDFDNDGDNDIVVAERFDPYVYGTGGKAYLMENDGTGGFTDVTAARAPAFQSLGMITDLEVTDINADGLDDLVIVGDWMSIQFFQNRNAGFSNVSSGFNLDKTRGWWNDIHTADLNKDGKPDFIIANHGLNTFFKPGDAMFVGDFDQNGSVEQIYCTKLGEKYFPIADKDDFISQLPSFRKTLLYYKEYSKKSIDDLIDEKSLSKAKHFEVDILESVVLLSGNGTYSIHPLPREAQYSPLYALHAADIDNDGIGDLIAAGNQFHVKPQFGRYDASEGWYFKGILRDGSFHFSDGVSLGVKGEIRGIESLRVKDKLYLIFAKHNDELEIYKINN